MINKKILMFIGMVLLAAGVAYASGVVFFGGNAHEDSNDKLVLDMDLTEANYDSGTKTFADDSGEGNDGVSANAAVFTTDKYGMSTGAMSFDGVGDYINCGQPSSLNFGTNSFSGSLWFKTSEVAYRGVIGRGNPYNTVGGKGWLLRVRSDETIEIIIDSFNSDADGVVTSDEEIIDGQWHHVSFVVDRNTDLLKLYIDGAETGTADDISGLDYFDYHPTYIGRYADSSGLEFSGDISGVKIYNRSLSATEVKSLYDSSKPKASAGSQHKGLVGHWALDSDGYNSNTERITDKTPYENHGTNVGATLTTDRMGHADKAMSFDGVGDYVDLSSDIVFNITTENYTFSMWHYIPTGSGTVWKGFIGSGLGVGGGYWLYHAGGKLGFYQDYYDSTLYWWMSDLNLGDEIPYDIWTHITVKSMAINTTHTNLTAYINGGQYYDSTIMLSSPRPVTTFQFRGVGRGDSNRYFNGSISDVRIYDRVLSVDEIKTLYDSYRPKASSGSLQKGLVLDMPLKLKYTKDETVGSEIMTDRTPYSNDGQNHGATVGSSYSSFVPNDYINCGQPSSLNFGTNSFSGSLWFKTSEVAYRGVIGRGNPYNTVGGKGWLLRVRSDETIEIIIDSFNSDADGVVTSDEEIIDGQWHHVSFVVDRNTDLLKLYIDGAETGTADDISGLDYFDYHPTYIGRYADSSGLEFSGDISGVKIYNRALLESEIKLLYDKGR